MARPTEFNFTVRDIKALPTPPAGERYQYRDTDTRGLILEVTSNGTKTFHFRRMVDGVRIKRRLGEFGELKIREARTRAGEMGADLARNKLKRSARRGQTVADFFERWARDHAEVNRPRTVYHDRSLFAAQVETALGEKRLQRVTTQDVESLYRTIRRRGERRTANAVLQLLSIMFNVAIRWGDHPGPNPVAAVTRKRDKPRERYLSADELRRLFGAMESTLAAAVNEDMPPKSKDALVRAVTDTNEIVQVALLTGARRANVFAMAWEEIDLEAALWTVPWGKTKTEDVYRVPLSRAVVQLLADRRRRVDGPWVFPAASRAGHVTTIQKRWKALLEAAGIKDFRFHDLRHTHAAWAVTGGASLQVIGKTLGHRSPTTTSRYAHVDLSPQRVAVERGAGLMLEAGGQGGDVEEE